MQQILLFLPYIKMEMKTIPFASIAKEEQLSFLVYYFADCFLVSIRMCGFLFFFFLNKQQEED